MTARTEWSKFSTVSKPRGKLGIFPSPRAYMEETVGRVRPRISLTSRIRRRRKPGILISPRNKKNMNKIWRNIRKHEGSKKNIWRNTKKYEEDMKKHEWNIKKYEKNTKERWGTIWRNNEEKVLRSINGRGRGSDIQISRWSPFPISRVIHEISQNFSKSQFLGRRRGEAIRGSRIYPRVKTQGEGAPLDMKYVKK